MEFYSNSKPNLIGSKMKKTVYKIMKKGSNNTISDKISNIMSSTYTNYVKDNLLLIISIAIIIIFLTYRYYNKKNRENFDKSNEANFNNSDNFNNPNDQHSIVDNILNQTNHLKYDSQPTLDILKSVDDQKEKVNYPPDPIRIDIPKLNNLPNQKDQNYYDNCKNYNNDTNQTIYARNIYPELPNFINLNTPNYNYNNVYDNNQLSYYTGTYNPYQHDISGQYGTIVNPLGFNTNFNQTTGEFIDGMTNLNKKNLYDYQSILDNMNNNLINSLKFGPEHLDINSPELEMDPPYSI